jgi:hypothetical protein
VQLKQIKSNGFQVMLWTKWTKRQTDGQVGFGEHKKKSIKNAENVKIENISGFVW